MPISTAASRSRTSSPQKQSHFAGGQAEKRQQREEEERIRRQAQDVVGLKDFQLGDCIGKGAFGSVYRAINYGTAETVAVKQVRLVDMAKSELRVIMLEIDLLKGLNHPNIVKYHGFEKDAESLFIILEYCENGSLHTISKNFGKFPENLVGLYMSQVLHGLLYLHEQGVIHRDIKGANILTTKEGLVKLADFGVATSTSALHDATVVGTPYWMAPEVIELAGATTASDIWSLGCTVIELLEGKPPYHHLQPMPALFRIVNDDHPPLPEGASPAVKDFLTQCFQKDPNLRVSAKKLLKHPWIASARRLEAVEHEKPLKHDQAIQSVKQWNEALRSPKAAPGRKNSQPQSSSPIPSRVPRDSARNDSPVRPQATQQSTPKLSLSRLKASNGDGAARMLSRNNSVQSTHTRSAQSIGETTRALTSRGLTPLAAESSDSDNWDENFEGELTVKSPIQLTHTQSAFARPPTAKSVLSARSRVAAKPQSKSLPQRTQDRTPEVTRISPRHTSRPAQLFREDTVEDFSDLILPNDGAFEQRVDVLKENVAAYNGPSKQHKVNFAPSSSTNGNAQPLVRPSPTTELLPIPRNPSLMTIAKYAEEEEDDYSDVFGQEGLRAANGAISDGSEPGTLMLNSKLSSSWLGDEDEGDDPFAELQEEFDEMDLDANIARDRYARVCSQVEAVVGSLKTSQGDDVLAELADQLLEILVEYPEMKSAIMTAHGLLPILEVLDECSRPYITLRLLKAVNMIIYEDVEIQENLCFVGGIPIISKFAAKRYSTDIRLEAAAFVQQITSTSTLTLQMFVSCGGLNVLVEFLEEDYGEQRDLVLIGVNGVWNVFELQGSTPKNDFCRIFSRSSVLYPLSIVLNQVLHEKGDFAEICEGRIVNIFYLFSQAENHVKEMVADRSILKQVLLDLSKLSPKHQITMLKFIKNLSMLSTTLDALQNSNAIETLIRLLDSSMHATHFREISNQVLNTMYNLCRLNKVRQQDAATCEIVPLLLKYVKTERPLKEFAYPILCDMAHSGRVGRTQLWRHRGLQFYISLLSDPYWAVMALDAIFIWLQEETARVEEHLLDGSFTNAIIKCFTSSKASALEGLLEPLQKMLRLSPLIAGYLATPEFFAGVADKLSHSKAVVRLNILRVIRSICDAIDDRGGTVDQGRLFLTITDLAEKDPAVLVRNMAEELLLTQQEREQQILAGRRLPFRRASSSTAPSAVSLPATPSKISRSAHSTFYHDNGFADILEDSPQMTPPFSPSRRGVYRPISRDGKLNGSVFRPTSRDGPRPSLFRPASRDSLSSMASTARNSLYDSSPNLQQTPDTSTEMTLNRPRSRDTTDSSRTIGGTPTSATSTTLSTRSRLPRVSSSTTRETPRSSLAGSTMAAARRAASKVATDRASGVNNSTRPTAASAARRRRETSSVI